MKTQSYVNPICLVLCGGKGTRMNSPTLHKVCFNIGGKPAIIRTLDALSEAGISRFVLVLGTMAGQVMECVASGYPEVSFAFQREPLGTGDAVKTGLNAVRSMGAEGPVMIVMGDKIIERGVVAELLGEFENDGAKAAFAVQPYEQHQSGGRVVTDETGAVRGIVEARDLEAALSGEGTVRIAGRSYSAKEIAAGKYVNAAVYLFDQETLASTLERLQSDNVQGELYLTDVIGMIAAEGEVVRAIPVTDPDKLLTFNTVEELLEVEERLLGRTSPKLSPSIWKTLDSWKALISSFQPVMEGRFKDVYGENDELIAERRRDYLRVLDCFAAIYGSAREVVLTRAPGRVNLMGRHVEHRGGWVNVIAVNKEIVCVAARREDDLVRIVNVDEDYPAEEFRIGDHFRDMNWQSWTDYLDADDTQKLVYEAKGRWVNYVKAAILRLQYHSKDRPLHGMDMAFVGSIPVAAGLSSSSAIVVAAAEAAVQVNGLDIEAQEFVDLCGEGEWFVGSRGGSGDHAAMKFGNRGNIAHLGFFPLRLEGLTAFPAGCKLVIANSFVRAQKTTNAKDVFNERIASYEFGLFYFWERFPETKRSVQRIRDINPATLGVPPSRIYEMLLQIPESATLAEIRSALPEEYASRIDRIAATHTVPERYPIRAVLLYGVAECRRSSEAQRVLAREDIEGFGRLMDVSHDGDRVVRYTDGVEEPHDFSVSDAKLQALINDLRSEDPERVAAAQIERQPGGYACSIPETDFLVDTAEAVPGVLGAQLSGAGLGGCVMVLVRDEALDPLIAELERRYYEPRGLQSGITVCIPVKGSMVWQINEAARTSFASFEVDQRAAGAGP